MIDSHLTTGGGQSGEDRWTGLSVGTLAADDPHRDAPLAVCLPVSSSEAPLPQARLLERLSEPAVLADEQGASIWNNPAFALLDDGVKARIAEVCRVAARGFRTGPALAPAQTAAFPADAQSASPASLAESGLPGIRCRYEALAADGRSCYEVSISDAGTDPLTGRRLVSAMAWDISNSRRAAQMTDAIARAGSELMGLDADHIRKMNTAERLRLLEQKIIKAAHDLLHFDHFAIRLIEDKSGKLDVVMSCNLPQEAIEVELYARREGNGISGFVAATGRSYICTDTQSDPRYVVGINAARSSLTIPLRMNDKVIGIFNVESTHPNAFTEQDRQFGEMFATYVAMALHMLDLLVVERSTTGKVVTGTVEGELSEPLEDISQVATRLKLLLASSAAAAGAAPADPASARLLERILDDVTSIKRRMKDVASGPATILGAERSIAEAVLDPLLVGKRVLVADDDVRIRQIVRDVLQVRGAEVLICENGETAIAALAAASSVEGSAASPTDVGPGRERLVGGGGREGRAGRGFDLIVSDIKMPDKTGYQIFAEARRTMPGVPVILMTGFGYDPHHSIVRASQEGLSCVLFKPFQADRLVEEVHKAIAKK